MSSNHPATQKARPLGARNASSPPKVAIPVNFPSERKTQAISLRDAESQVVSILRMAGQAGEDPNTQIRNIFVILAAALNEAALIIDSKEIK